MSKSSAIELAARLYGKLQNLCHLFAVPDNVRFYLAACDNMEGKLQTSVADSYRCHFNILNNELAEIMPPGNMRWSSEIGGVITNTIAYQRESLLPISANTFADESIEIFVRLKGLYLRLAESMLIQDDIRSKVNRDCQIWRQFGVDAEFDHLRKGLTWEYSVVNRLVSESAVVEPMSELERLEQQYLEAVASDKKTRDMPFYQRLVYLRKTKNQMSN